MMLTKMILVYPKTSMSLNIMFMTMLWECCIKVIYAKKMKCTQKANIY